MRRAAVSLACLSLLVSCQSTQQRQASDDAYCKSIGATGNMYAQCMIQRDYMRAADLDRRRAMLAASAQIMSTPAPRQTTTTCHQVGGNVVCNSF